MTCFIVHTIPGSPFARPVMAMLIDKGADWRIGRLSPGDQLREPHLSRQPFGKMPALEWDGQFLYETQAILRFLDEYLPGPSFTPATIGDRARMNQAIGICDSYLFPGAGRVIVFQRVIGPRVTGLVPDEAAIAAAMPLAQVILDALSHLLADRAWFGGDAVSIADLMLAGQLELFARTPEWSTLTAALPNLTAWLARIEARPAMAQTVMERLRELMAQQTAQ